MKHLWIVGILLVFAAMPSSPGVVFEIETTDHSASPPRSEGTNVSVEGRMIKMDVSPAEEGGGDGEMIFRGDRGEHGEVVVVDHDEKAYWVMDDKAVQDLAGQVDKAMSAVEEALKHLPKEQRDAIEKARRQGAAGAGAMPQRPKAEVRKTGERADKQGYPCVKYEVYRGAHKVREIWTTDWDNVEGGDEAEEAFKALAAFFKALAEAMPQQPGGPIGGLLGGENPVDEMNFGNGFPVVTRSFDEAGNPEEESTLRSAQRRPLDPAEFEPPAGYKRRSMGPY